ncbi:hypothetical protein SPSIL_044360 [Sporomusa silvacetica DSM 10669]|uniref:HTH merR-type domain-containing protein n=1 Tax=Sporomusa silvacetica DSM 10669 TaxID=1123289 RepID=A0ABZ3IR77_9FIRM|nr:MerR family transcriptional regulator [Sporomusa silvacetica]OZC20697.1 multidrug-efflux transporter 1 regulator [Sporomusa silvacetica DSM 10669]
MYTIGQFSRICRLTVKALRHYETIGFFKPALVQKNTQYRYYSPEQIVQAELIRTFREFGMPLKTISIALTLYQGGHSLEKIMEEHRQMLLRQNDELNGKLLKLTRWLEKEKPLIIKPNLTTSIKLIPELPVISKRAILSNMPEQLPKMMRNFHGEFSNKGICCNGPLVNLYHKEGFDPACCDVEVALPVADPTQATGTLPAVRAASCTHIGSYDGHDDAYASIFAWVNTEGEKIVYPIRELYYNDPAVTPPESLVMEIVIPLQERE